MTTTSPFGAKHSCVNCGSRFYDLNKPAACPKCGQKVPKAESAGRKPKPKRAK